jgi:hypothetical protein
LQDKIKGIKSIIRPTQPHIFKNLEIKYRHIFRLEMKPSPGQYVGIKVKNTKKRMDNGKKQNCS